MLHRLSANKEEFQLIDFVPGLNVILAERSPQPGRGGQGDQGGQGDRGGQGRARGKTTLLEAVGFCLGGRPPAALRSLARANWDFSLEFDLLGARVVATRALRAQERVRVDVVAGPPPQPLAQRLREDGTLALSDWSSVLGTGLYGLEDAPDTTGTPTPTLSPTLSQTLLSQTLLSPTLSQKLLSQTLLRYAIRLSAPKDPTRTGRGQPEESARLHSAFLLGLPWQQTRELIEIRRDEQELATLLAAGRRYVLPGLSYTEAELLARHARAVEEVARARERQRTFRPAENPDVRVHQTDAITARLADLFRAQVTESRLLRLYESTMDHTGPIRGGRDLRDLRELYRELGRTFSPQAVADFEEVVQFHQSVVVNRRRFLATEVERLRDRIGRRAIELDLLTERRAALLAELTSRGVIAELLDLQRRTTRAEERLRRAEESLEISRRLQRHRDHLARRKLTIRRTAAHILAQDHVRLAQLDACFGSLVHGICDRPGAIRIGVDELGYEIRATVAGSTSRKLQKIRLLCFDLAILGAQRPVGPDFLVHDSTVFDGLPPHRVGAALTLSRAIAEGAQGQYIAALDSDAVPAAVLSQDWFAAAVRRRIHPDEPGGALGVAF